MPVQYGNTASAICGGKKAYAVVWNVPKSVAKSELMKNEIILKPIIDNPVLQSNQTDDDEVRFRLTESVSVIVFTKSEIVVLGTPDSEEMLAGLPEEEWHNCDFLGCGQSHVLRRINLTEQKSVQADDGLTLATLCDMVLGEEAADRSNDALVSAVGGLGAKEDNGLIKENNILREEIEVTDKILVERTRVLEAVPPCDLHGSLCIPHALDWIAERTAIEMPFVH